MALARSVFLGVGEDLLDLLEGDVLYIERSCCDMVRVGPNK